MGNGALLQTNDGLLTRDDFIMLEKLCKKQHFRDNFAEYRNSFERAIINEAIDIIEILIPAGNSKKIFPLHLACKLAKLESAELLLSAGFSALHQDEHGQTPLHLCSNSRSLASGLCASLLSLSAKKSLTMRDREGLTPLHLAAAQNNLHVIEALMSNGADITMTSSTGKTAYQIAADNHNVEALRLLKDAVSHRNKREHTATATTSTFKLSCNSRCDQHKLKAESKVEYDRIMQVWERFFENAFQRLGIDVTEEEEEQEGSYLLHSQHSFNSTPVASARSCTSSSATVQSAYGRDPAGSDSRHFSEPSSSFCINRRRESDCHRGASMVAWDDSNNSGSSSQVNTSSDKGSYEGVLVGSHEAPHAIDWFQWVVCYQANEMVDWAEDIPPGEYYVLNKYTGETCWLDEHITAFARGTLLFCGDWDDYELHMTHPLPTSLTEAVGRGWLTYYASTENICRWISIPTKSVEDYLPLGLGEKPATLQELELLPCEADPMWYLSDQSCAQAWVMVLAPAEQNIYDSDVYYEQATLTYYQNRITGETSWDPPEGWTELVTVSWQGWTLCCSEDAPYNLYWFDFESGESVWAQE